MGLLHDKIWIALEDAGWTLRQAALEANIPYTTLHSAMKNKRALPFETVDAIAQALNISTHFFSNVSRKLAITDFRADARRNERALEILDRAFQAAEKAIAYRGGEVGLEDFLNWWHTNNGRLEGFDGLADYVDIFDPPSSTSKYIAPKRIGRNSLATLSFKSETVDHLRETLRGFSDETNSQLIAAHLTAINTGQPVITHPTLDETLRSGENFSKMYRRVLAPIYTTGGALLVANFSQDIRPPQVR